MVSEDLNLKVIITRDFQADLHFENQRFQTRKRDWMLIYYLKSALAFLCFLFGRAISVFPARSFSYLFISFNTASPKSKYMTLKKRYYFIRVIFATCELEYIFCNLRGRDFL